MSESTERPLRVGDLVELSGAPCWGMFDGSIAPRSIQNNAAIRACFGAGPLEVRTGPDEFGNVTVWESADKADYWMLHPSCLRRVEPVADAKPEDWEDEGGELQVWSDDEGCVYIRAFGCEGVCVDSESIPFAKEIVKHLEHMIRRKEQGQ